MVHYNSKASQSLLYNASFIHSANTQLFPGVLTMLVLIVFYAFPVECVIILFMTSMRRMRRAMEILPRR